MSSLMEGTELQEALEIIESTNLKYFTKEMVAEFMALKGSFLAQIGRYIHVYRVATILSEFLSFRLNFFPHL